jgi:uncharacterized protein (TIGR02266 family)
MPDNNQKREHDRTEIVFKIDYRTPKEFLADYTANASGGGVFIKTQQPFEVGKIITFNISFPGLIAPFVCVGEVRWRRSKEEATEERPAGIGVEFKFDTAGQSQDIRRLVDALLREKSDEGPSDAADEGISSAFHMLLVGPRKSVLRMFHFAMESSRLASAADRERLVVDEVVSGQHAWDRIQEKHYDLIVVDLDMRVMSGLELLGLIRGNEATQQLSVATVGPDTRREEAYAAGADLFLGTPINLIKLFKSLLQILHLNKTVFPEHSS